MKKMHMKWPNCNSYCDEEINKLNLKVGVRQRKRGKRNGEKSAGATGIRLLIIVHTILN